MFCGQLINSEIAPRHLEDTVGSVLQGMETLRTGHLPVVEGEQFLGLVSEDELLDEHEEILLSSVRDRFITAQVKVGDYFLVAVRLMHLMDLDQVAVINEKNEYEGVISREVLFHELARKTGAEEHGSLVVLEMSQTDYSVGELNRLVESNDAVITQLNSWADPTTHHLTVILRINKTEISDVVSSFQRHEYNVVYYLGEELFRNELQSNLDHLMNYLNI